MRTNALITAKKSQCQEWGAGICELDSRRSQCKSYSGSTFCELDRERGSCKSCGGFSICEHGRIRSVCKRCGGPSICERNRTMKLGAYEVKRWREKPHGPSCLITAVVRTQPSGQVQRFSLRQNKPPMCQSLNKGPGPGKGASRYHNITFQPPCIHRPSALRFHGHCVLGFCICRHHSAQS